MRDALIKEMLIITRHSNNTSFKRLAFNNEL